MTTNTSSIAVPSPCVGICSLDEATGYCLGCARTSVEIAEWRDASDNRRREVWSALPARSAQLGLTITRLPWSHQETLRFVTESLRTRSGTWVLGCYGAVAEFNIEADRMSEFSVVETIVTAVTDRAALRLVITDKVQPLTVRDDRSPGRSPSVILAIHKTRLTLPVATTLTALGPDNNAISVAGRRSRLFDLGLGRPEMRFCVRTSDRMLTEVLDNAEGTAWPEHLAAISPAILKENPVRVVETALGRAEIRTGIPRPDETSPEGPHTHLLPELLVLKRDLAPGLDLPPAYVAGAVFY